MPGEASSSQVSRPEYRRKDSDKRSHLKRSYILGGMVAVIIVLYSFVSKYDPDLARIPTVGSNPAAFDQSARRAERLPPIRVGPALEENVVQKRSEPSLSIRFGNDTRFKANWTETPLGLAIKRLHEGPLKEAALLVGDILTTIDGKLATDKEMLLVRDEIVSGERKKAIVGVTRGQTTIFFSLQK